MPNPLIIWLDFRFLNMNTYRILSAVATGSIEAVYNNFDRAQLSRFKSFYRNEGFDVVIDVGSQKGEFINGVIDDETPIHCF